MRVINPRYFAAANLEPEQSFFVELWHSMTHISSLDTYRIRCLNSRTIVRELSEELAIGRVKDEELSAIVAEAKAIIESDPTCKRHFSSIVERLTPFLTQAPTGHKDKKKEDAKKQDDKLTQFRFILADFSVSLERSYLGHLCADLRESIIPNNEDNVRAIVSSLLSDLADRGWPLETLFTWPQNFLRNPHNRSFDQNLDFMLRTLQSDRQDFDVTLKLSRCANLPTIEQQGEFSFSSLSGIQADKEPDINKFATAYQSVCFAKTCVRDYDHRSAAINAREKLEQTIDLLRFGFEPDKLSIENACYVTRRGDNRQQLVLIPHVLPNPTDDSPYRDFRSFSDDLNAIGHKNTIEPRSRTQLQAAIRQYRFGRDVDNYRDKFLYWWMGLEALARDEIGPIGSTVGSNVSYCMANVYLPQVLRDYLQTVQYCQIEWNQELATCSGANDLNSLSPQQLLTVILEKKDVLNASCQGHPILALYGKNLTESLCDPKKTAELLQRHLDHLRWHLARLYRIRCNIVHGSESSFRLRLFAANLEYYLRQAILITIDTFKNSDHITSLEELFLRASIGCEHILGTLRQSDANRDSTREALFKNHLTMAN